MLRRLIGRDQRDGWTIRFQSDNLQSPLQLSKLFLRVSSKSEPGCSECQERDHHKTDSPVFHTRVRRKIRRLAPHESFLSGGISALNPAEFSHGFFRNPESAIHSSKREAHAPTGLRLVARRPKPWPPVE